MKKRALASRSASLSHARTSKKAVYYHAQTDPSDPERADKHRRYHAKKQQQYYAAKTPKQKAEYAAKRRARREEKKVSMTPEELNEHKLKRSLANAKRNRLDSHELVCKVAKCCGWKGSNVATCKNHLKFHCSKWSKNDKCPNPSCHAVFDSIYALRSHLYEAHVDRVACDAAPLADAGKSGISTSDDGLLEPTTDDPRSYGPHAKCRFCGCCVPTKDVFAHMEVYCLVRNSPTLAPAVADCQDVQMDLHCAEDHPVCSCASVSREIAESCRNPKLLAAMSDDSRAFHESMGTAAYKDFMGLVSKMSAVKKPSNGYVYIAVVYDASKPNRSFRQFIREDEFYVGFATDLNARATLHRKEHICAMRYEADARSLIKLYGKMREVESKGHDVLLVGLGDEQGPQNFRDAGIFVESMTLIVLGLQTQFNGVLSLATRNVEPWMQEMFPKAAEVVVPLLVAAYKRLYVNSTGMGVHVLTDSGQRLPFRAESTMPPLKAEQALRTASHAFCSTSSVTFNADVQQSSSNSSVSHAATCFTNGNITSCSPSKRYLTAKSSIAVPYNQVPESLKVVPKMRKEGCGVAQDSTCSGHSALLVKRRRLDPEIKEGSSKTRSTFAGVSGNQNHHAKTSGPIISLLTMDGMLITDFVDAVKNGTLKSPPVIEGRRVTNHVMSAHFLMQKLDCTLEEVVRIWNPASFSVASDGVSSSYLPVVSPVIIPKQSDSGESVELWPDTKGFVGTFAQAQRKHG